MLKEFMEKIHKKNINRVLDKKQEEVNQLFAEEGLTDEVLSKQLEINQIRHQENIPDSSERVYDDFVQ